MMIKKTNSKKNLKSNGNLHVSDEIKMKDNSEIKGIKRKLTKNTDNESKKKKIKKKNSAEESKKVFEESTTNLSPKKRKKAKLGVTSVLKKDVNAGDSDDKQVKGATVCHEEPDQNEDANRHKNVQIKGNGRSGGCLNCQDPDHYTWACENVCKLCIKKKKPDGHKRKDCPLGIAKSGGCLNCHDPNHTFRTCENECKFCPDNTDGHMRKDCPKAGFCRNCKRSGHYAYKCEEECKYCNDNSDGHVRKDCQKGKTCFNCNQIGHVLRDCPDKEQE
ncbi:UNVERIFIED_CONTAM: hypothetical protein RMT77_011308 [Armadillidium vulgare]